MGARQEIVMNQYTVRITASITEKRNIDGIQLAPSTYLSYSTEFEIQGENLTAIAPQIDHIMEGIKDCEH